MSEQWRFIDPNFELAEAIDGFELVVHPSETVFRPNAELLPDSEVDERAVIDALNGVEYAVATPDAGYRFLGNRDLPHIRNMAAYLEGSRKRAAKDLDQDYDSDRIWNNQQAAERSVRRFHQDDLSMRGLAAQWQHDLLFEAIWSFDDRTKTQTDTSEAKTRPRPEGYNLEELIGIELIRRMLNDFNDAAARRPSARDEQFVNKENLSLLERGLNQAVALNDLDMLMRFSTVAMAHYEKKARCIYLELVRLTDSRKGGTERRSPEVREAVFLYQQERQHVRRQVPSRYSAS